MNGLAKLRELTLRLNQRDADLHESQCFYRSLLSCVPAAILTIDPGTGMVKYVNKTFVAMTRFPVGEALGQTPPYSWWPETHHQKYLKLLSQGMEIGLSAREGLFVTRDGSDLWVEVTSMLVEPETTESYYLSTFRDITRRRVAEEQLRCTPDTVLIVEDNPTDCRVLNDILTVAGYTVDVATTLQEVLPAAAKRPSVAIIDLRLQECDGLRAGQAIQKLSLGTKLIVLTGYPDQSTTASALRIGLVKPYDITELLEMMHGD